MAAEIRDSWDPVKKKLRELERKQEEAQQAEVLIEEAVERWLLSLRSQLDNNYTYRKYAYDASMRPDDATSRAKSPGRDLRVPIHGIPEPAMLPRPTVPRGLQSQDFLSIVLRPFLSYIQADAPRR